MPGRKTEGVHHISTAAQNRQTVVEDESTVNYTGR